MATPPDVHTLFPIPEPARRPVILTIDLGSQVDYRADISDPAQLATVSAATTAATPRNFFVVTLIADIIQVNGQPAKGTYVGRTRVINSSPNPANGGAIADVKRTAMREHIFEILTTDGTEVGTIISTGFSGGIAPSGIGVSSIEKASWVIVGGTGAYMGVQGQVCGTGGSGRAASMSEDPGNRRINGGTSNQFVLHVVPMDPPAIVADTPHPNPAIFHSDFVRVTAAKPAIPGEVLSLFATGLGPTSPDVDLTHPFPLSPPSTVNAPVTIAVAGKAAEVVSAVGFPDAWNGYRVDFKMPQQTGSGEQPLVLTAAWIPAAPVGIAVQ
jgi:hypothetical protein